jgi:nucleoside-diphosphate-sugar epimerase
VVRIDTIGGAGFVGTRLIPELVAARYEVTVLDLGIFPRGIEALNRLAPEAHVIRGDLRDTELVADGLEGCDTVISLAGMSNDPTADLRPELTKEINLTATLALINASEKAGCRRFINISSASVYGVQPEETEVHEEVHAKPQTLYARYKLETELYALSRHHAGFEVISIRPATLSGWSPRARLDLTANIFTYQALAHGEISVFGGEQQRPNLHIDDLVSMLARLPEADGCVYGATYNLNEGNYTVRELAGAAADVVGRETGAEIAIRIVDSHDNRSYRLCTDRARQMLGFKAAHLLAEAITDTMRGILAVGVEAAATPEFRNVAWLKGYQW